MINEPYRKFRDFFLSGVVDNRIFTDDCNPGGYESTGGAFSGEGLGHLIDTLESGGYLRGHGYHTKLQTKSLLRTQYYSRIEKIGVISDRFIDDDEENITFDLSLDNGLTWYTGYSSELETIVKPSDSYAKGYVWATASSINIPRLSATACGTVDATLLIGGRVQSVVTPVFYNSVERFDGNTWYNTTALPTSVGFLASCGTVNAALVFGGANSGYTGINTTYIWGGSSWATTTATLNYARQGLAGCGTASAALAFGSAGDYNQITEVWDGSIWTVTNSMITGIYDVNGCGTTSSAIAISANAMPGNPTQSWNGFTWSTKTSPPIIYSSKPAIVGTSNTDAVCFSDYNTCSLVNNTWTTTSSLIRPRFLLSGSGINTWALAIGGEVPNTSNMGSIYVEKYVRTNNYTKLRFNIPESYNTYVWSSTSNMNYNRSQHSLLGDGTTCLAAGGEYNQGTFESFLNTVEGFDGYAWSTTTSLTNRRKNAIGVATSRISGFVIAGVAQTSSSSTAMVNSVLKWSENGGLASGSWSTTVANISLARKTPGGFGNTSSAIVFGGITADIGATNRTDKWNGSAWSTTSTANLPMSVGDIVGCGTTASAVCFGGRNTLETRLCYNFCAKWSGAAWSTTTNLLYGTDSHAGFGDFNNTVCLGTRQYEEPYFDTTLCQSWDGITWSTTTNLPSFIMNHTGCGNATNGFVCGGAVRPSQTTMDYPYAYLKTTYLWRKTGRVSGFTALFK